MVSHSGAKPLVTTDKDFVRLPANMKAKVRRASVDVRFDDPAAFARVLDRAIA